MYRLRKWTNGGDRHFDGSAIPLFPTVSSKRTKRGSVNRPHHTTIFEKRSPNSLQQIYVRSESPKARSKDDLLHTIKTPWKHDLRLDLCTIKVRQFPCDRSQARPWKTEVNAQPKSQDHPGLGLAGHLMKSLGTTGLAGHLRLASRPGWPWEFPGHWARLAKRYKRQGSQD